jgi:hypothetical protein
VEINRTNEALKVGRSIVLLEVLVITATVKAPGGKLVAMEIVHIMIAIRTRIGPRMMTSRLNIRNGLNRILNSDSIVDTCKVLFRRVYQRCWVKAIASELFRLRAKAFARMFDAVETKDCAAA